MMIGYQSITINGVVPIHVGVSYMREGRRVEFLEGWINPLVASMLHPSERESVILRAKAAMLERILYQTSQWKDVEKRWEGVSYG